MYFITCFDDKWLQNKRWFFGIEEAPRGENGRVQYLKAASRTFGYFAKKDDALQAVLANSSDLHERLYTLCVVERIPQGIHAWGDEAEQVWFKWIPSSEDQPCYWQETDRPEETRRTLNFAIG